MNKSKPTGSATRNSAQLPTTTRVASVVLGSALWLLWIWMLFPSSLPGSSSAQIARVSAGPTLHIAGLLLTSYAVAVGACRLRPRRQARPASN